MKRCLAFGHRGDRQVSVFSLLKSFRRSFFSHVIYLELPDDDETSSVLSLQHIRSDELPDGMLILPGLNQRGIKSCVCVFMFLSASVQMCGRVGGISTGVALSHRGSSSAGSEPVPDLKPGLCVSTAKEPALGQETRVGLPPPISLTKTTDEILNKF